MLTHIDENGRAKMVEVGEKQDTMRVALAEAKVLMKRETLERIVSGGIKKGDVFAVAQVAGIMAAKRTSEIIPMCHNIALTGVDMSFREDFDECSVTIEATARTFGKTGVEMEALHAASAAALTIYDMCKAIDRGMTITDIRLMEKSGGKSGDWRRNNG